MFVNINKFLFEYCHSVLTKKVKCPTLYVLLSLSLSLNNGITPVSVILVVNISAEYKQYLVWEKHTLNLMFVQH